MAILLKTCGTDKRKIGGHWDLSLKDKKHLHQKAIYGRVIELFES